MLRIHFDSDDLARVRVADAPDLLWETLLSLHVLQGTMGEVVFGAWRSRVRGRLDQSVRMLMALTPPRGYSPDFLTPCTGATELAAAVDALLTTPKSALCTDLTLLACEQRLPPWASSLARGDVDTLKELGAALRRYHTVALEPHWSAISSQVRADRLRRGEDVLRGGVERLLATLHPSVRWRSPVLEVAYPVEQELHLGGRGLLLVPSMFCWQAPITLLDPARQPVLVYPVERNPSWSTGVGGARSTTALLGRTRAAVLEAICGRPELTTTELAKEVGISLAGASQHATVLRNSGLITTDRAGGTARHRPTPFGMTLLTVGAT
ncbi:winged helix-turn-helix domain-containing protein [Actinokineospora auranticolor]|uniref:Helix-turn-helix protein n=1 Tax=Actinokineospora auranticolor TaxID=155976 RepID=A0A2S6H0Y9_9PSEU|nr:winged helix-turn-helix domain-containing protein [Actinokineospora auranticolor]PPK71148.1 helix-turn-helix protein [Actinokineospora auranticolor]